MKNRLFLAMTLVVSIGILTACSQGTKETEKPTEAVKATEVAKETEKVTDAVKATEAIKETEKVTDATEETEANTEGYILVETRPVKETEKVTEAIVAETESEVGVVAETEPDTENVDDTWSKEVIISTLQQSFNCTEEDAVKLKLSIELLSDKIKSIVGITKGANPDLNDETYIGFTGTPISKEDRNTREVFGDYIDVYDMTQAVEDGATTSYIKTPVLNNYVGYIAEDFQLSSMYTGVHLQVMHHLGDVSGSKQVSAEYSHMLDDFFSKKINGKATVL